MTEFANISNVAYKKGDWLRYTIWSIVIVLMVALAATFIDTIKNGNISASIPEGYNFTITDNYTEGSSIRTRYYVYNDKIIVEDESTNNNEVSRSIFIYDNINTSGLQYDSETIELCELGACREKPRILATIKKLVSRKIGREYIGF